MSSQGFDRVFICFLWVFLPKGIAKLGNFNSASPPSREAQDLLKGKAGMWEVTLRLRALHMLFMCLSCVF